MALEPNRAPMTKEQWQQVKQNRRHLDAYRAKKNPGNAIALTPRG